MDDSLAILNATDRRFFIARLGLFLAGVLMAFLALLFGLGKPGLFAFLALVIAFLVVVALHRRLIGTRLRYQRVQALTAAQLARMKLDWANIPVDPEPPAEPAHPFATDIDLLGDRSLHRLLDTAASLAGSRRLRDWLLATEPDPPTVAARQAVLRELLALPGFRHMLMLSGLELRENLSRRWDGDALLRWLEASVSSRSLTPLLALLLALAATNITLFVLNMLGLLPPVWLATLALYGGIYLYKNKDYSELFDQTFRISGYLEQLRTVLAGLESYPYPKQGGGQSLTLRGLVAPFLQEGQRPSSYLRRIAWLTSAASMGENPVLGFFINLIVPWNLFFTRLLERYKAGLRRTLPGWLDAWYELESLSSLANFAYLNPGYTFPTLRDWPAGDTRAVFAARAIGHPLIPHEVKACNDFAIDALGKVTLITGSNMSGKSTFLRTLGVNLALTYAGGPVNAEALETIPFRLFTAIQVSNSLSYGISYFYAEVRRLKALLDALARDDSYPLFFLVDEIFRGTNNEERRIGSRAYVRALENSYGAGVISTHDLELTHLGEGEPQVRNLHFREDVRDGKMVFDYKLRPGPSPTTNALKIMAMEGLPVNGGQ